MLHFFPFSSDGTIVGLGGAMAPLNFFKFFFSVYIYICVLILVIYFNKFAPCPLNNIIGLFKGYKIFFIDLKFEINLISLTKKIHQ